MYRFFFKRLLDILFSLFGIVVFAIPMLIIAIVVKIDSKGPAIFKTERVGKKCKSFKFYKFRSMRTDAPKDCAPRLLKSEDYITKVGAFLRKTSLDELPQLFCILKGDMSIIGPRPPLPEEVAQYTPYQMHRLDVITGLACYHECQGRSEETDFEKWVEADLKYIRERSMLTDLKIIFMTIKVVLTGDGAM